MRSVCIRRILRQHQAAATLASTLSTSRMHPRSALISVPFRVSSAHQHWQKVMRHKYCRLTQEQDMGFMPKTGFFPCRCVLCSSHHRRQNRPLLQCIANGNANFSSDLRFKSTTTCVSRNALATVRNLELRHAAATVTTQMHFLVMQNDETVLRTASVYCEWPHCKTATPTLAQTFAANLHIQLCQMIPSD